MKFVPRSLGRSAEASSGGGDGGLVKELLTLAVLITITLVILYFVVVAIIEMVVAGVSPQREQEMFRKMGEWVEASEVPPSLADKFARCEQVLEKLRSFEEVPQIDYQLVYMEQLSPNAFAVPGGTIVVTRGLLNALDEEVAIAFVLAHELGHFAQRDHLRGLGRKLGFGVGVRLLFGGNLESFSQGTTGLVLAKHSRKQESSADDFGLRCILTTYGETEGAEALFKVLEEQSGSAPQWAYMFSTHPDNKSRIRKILEAKKP